MNDKKANISIFIPHAGCPHKCSFCDQKSITSSSCPSVEYVKKYISDSVLKLKDGTKAEIAFFGGSFTLIDTEYMTGLLTVANGFLGEKITGIRISTRPDGINEKILKLLKEYGVTSVELGAQSMCDDVLEMNNRGHDANSVRKASALIKRFDFELGLQMMTGLLGDTVEKSVYTAREIINLKPDTVRIYPTVVLKNTQLGELFEKGEYLPFDLEKSVDLCSELLKMFEENEIRVIKLGLHSSVDVEKDMLGGCYHPAFRELCESKLFLEKVTASLGEKNKGKNFEIYVHPKNLSKMIGQGKSNIIELGNRGYNCSVKPDESLYEYQVEIKDKN